MGKRVILITGTPCVGKTTLARKMGEQLKAQYINLTVLAETEYLVLGRDEERQTTIVDEAKMRRRLRSIISKAQSDIVIDGHFAAAVTPKALVTHVFVLRRNPIELRQFMQKCGFSHAKLYENLSAEILDSCLVEAMQTQSGKVCELDVTGKTIEENVAKILDVLDKGKKCYTGIVDWLGMLEQEGLTDQYLKE